MSRALAIIAVVVATFALVVALNQGPAPTPAGPTGTFTLSPVTVSPLAPANICDGDEDETPYTEICVEP